MTLPRTSSRSRGVNVCPGCNAPVRVVQPIWRHGNGSTTTLDGVALDVDENPPGGNVITDDHGRFVVARPEDRAQMPGPDDGEQR